MFIAALFVIVPDWKISKYLSTDEWLKKLSYVYTMGIVLNNKKE